METGGRGVQCGETRLGWGAVSMVCSGQPGPVRAVNTGSRNRLVEKR